MEKLEKVRFRSLSLGQGANTALPIYGNFMKRYYKLYTKHRYVKFKEPQASAMRALKCDMYRENAPGEGLDDFFLLLKQKRMERQVKLMEQKMQRKLDRDRRRRKKKKSRFKRN